MLGECYAITWESDPEYIRRLLYVSSVPLSTSRKRGLFLEFMCKVMSASRKKGLFLEVKADQRKKQVANYHGSVNAEHRPSACLLPFHHPPKCPCDL